MSRSSTSSSDALDEGPPLPALGDGPADDRGGHQVPPVRHRATRGVVLWSIGCIVVLLLVAEMGARALGDLPPNRIWPDTETQFKADHASAVAAAGERERLVFAGSSVSDAAFDPAVVQEAAGLDGGTFNYAVEGSLASTTRDFLDAAVIDQVDPEVVVLGVFPGDIGASPTNAARLGDQVARSRGFRLASGRPTLQDRIDDEASRRSALIAHREVLRDPWRLALWLRSPTTPGFLDADSGALLRHRDAHLDPSVEVTSDGDERTPVGPQVAAIEQLAADLAERGTRLVVVELPVRTTAPGAADQHARDVTHRAMIGVEEAGCAERLDLRDLAQDDRYWSDAAHVNGAGTQVISEAVGAWLAENPDAPAGC